MSAARLSLEPFAGEISSRVDRPEETRTVDSAEVLEHFPTDEAGPSSLAREFASRMMMLFDVGADSGANFSEYWTSMVELRGGAHKALLRGFGPLFQFVYQKQREAELKGDRASLATMPSKTTVDVHRGKLADQVQAMLAKLQRSIDAASSSTPAVKRTSIESVVDGLESISADQLRALDMTDNVLNATLARAREALKSVGAERPLQLEPMLVQGLPSKHAAHPHPMPQTTRIPRPPLPTIGGAKPLKSNQLTIELPLRPYVSPSQIPAQFDIAQFQAALTPRPVVSRVHVDAKPLPLPKMTKDDMELMKRIQSLREEVLSSMP